MFSFLVSELMTRPPPSVRSYHCCQSADSAFCLWRFIHYSHPLCFLLCPRLITQSLLRGNMKQHWRLKRASLSNMLVTRMLEKAVFWCPEVCLTGRWSSSHGPGWLVLVVQRFSSHSSPVWLRPEHTSCSHPVTDFLDHWVHYKQEVIIVSSAAFLLESSQWGSGSVSLQTTSGPTRTCCWTRTFPLAGEPSKTPQEPTTGTFPPAPPSGNTPATLECPSLLTYR